MHLTYIIGTWMAILMLVQLQSSSSVNAEDSATLFDDFSMEKYFASFRSFLEDRKKSGSEATARIFFDNISLLPLLLPLLLIGLLFVLPLLLPLLLTLLPLLLPLLPGLLFAGGSLLFGLALGGLLRGALSGGAGQPIIAIPGPPGPPGAAGLAGVDGPDGMDGQPGPIVVPCVPSVKGHSASYDEDHAENPEYCMYSYGGPYVPVKPPHVPDVLYPPEAPHLPHNPHGYVSSGPHPPPYGPYGQTSSGPQWSLHKPSGSYEQYSPYEPYQHYKPYGPHQPYEPHITSPQGHKVWQNGPPFANKFKQWAVADSPNFYFRSNAELLNGDESNQQHVYGTDPDFDSQGSDSSNVEKRETTTVRAKNNFPTTPQVKLSPSRNTEEPLEQHSTHSSGFSTESSKNYKSTSSSTTPSSTARSLSSATPSSTSSSTPSSSPSKASSSTPSSPSSEASSSTPSSTSSSTPSSSPSKASSSTPSSTPSSPSSNASSSTPSSTPSSPSSKASSSTSSSTSSTTSPSAPTSEVPSGQSTVPEPTTEEYDSTVLYLLRNP